MTDKNFFLTVREEAPDRPLLSLWLDAVKISAPVTVEELQELANVLGEYLKGLEPKP